MNKIIVISLSLFCLVFFYEGGLIHFSERVYFTSQLIMIFSIVMIFNNDGRAYSLRKMFYLFTFFFFGIAPLVQFHSRTSFFRARLLKEEEYFYLNILILVIMFLYEFFYFLFSKSYSRRSIKFVERFELKKLNLKESVIILFLSILSLTLVFYLNDFNINRLLFRGGEMAGSTPDDSALSSSSSSSLNLVIGQTIRPMAMICLLYYILSPYRKNFISIILFIFALLAVFPSGVPRFYAAAVYIPLLIISFKIFEKKNVFSLIFIVALLVVFPFLNNFRHFSKNTELKLKLDFNMFTEGHFDSYQNFALIFFEDIITYGRQILGVLFFWLPRSLWQNKPIGSGYVIAEKFNFSWLNVSANFFAEGYINFGLLGILLFVLILSYFTSFLDYVYWTKVVLKKNNFLKVVYLILLGMLFFMMRGDLLSSTAFTVGFMISIFIVFKLTNRKKRYK